MSNYASVPSSKTRKAGRIRTKFESDEKFYQEMNASLTDFLANDPHGFQYPITNGTTYTSSSPPRQDRIKQNTTSHYNTLNPDSNVASTLFPDDPQSRRKAEKQRLGTSYNNDNSLELKLWADTFENTTTSGDSMSTKNLLRWTPSAKKGLIIYQIIAFKADHVLSF